MTTRLKYGRAGALAVIGGTLCLLTAAAPASAQVSSCVGDCSNTQMVRINDLILGVNIDLGSQPVSACPAFANAQGKVDIAQLIKGVNNALNGCPVLPTPTNTGTPVGTSTATVTATPTTPPIQHTPTASPTPTTGTSPIGAHTCTFVKACSGGTHRDCTTDADCLPDEGTCTGNSKSGVALYAGAFPVPLNFGLGGSAKIDCGTPDATGKTQCTCDILNADPINIPGVGFVCIAAAPTPCPSNSIYCDGGPPVGLSVRSDGKIGACTSNDACKTMCDTYCAGIGSAQVSSSCTGYCNAGSMKACNLDADCLPNDGACNGPDPVGTKNDICQCGCANTAAGDGSKPGDFGCNLGANLVVEMHSPCDGSDILINVGAACIPLSTGNVSTLITNANFAKNCSSGTKAACTTDADCMPNNGTCVGATVPGSGVPASATGQPITCDNLRAGTLGGLQIRGAVNFFGSTLGDLATGLATFCK